MENSGPTRPRQFSPDRIDDMLRIYAEKEIAAERLKAKRELAAPEITGLRLRGECRAWVIHDSFFIWERPLSNTFEELRDFVRSGDSSHRSRQLLNWEKLREYTIEKAMTLLLLCSPHYIINPPVMLPEKQYVLWWMYMAVIHECDRQIGK